MDERLIQQQEQELAKTGRYYLHVCFMTIPLLCMACFLYGLRPLLLCGAALLTGNLCDRLVSLLRRRVYRAGDFSNESFALIIALLMPATVDWYVVIMAVLAGVLIGKEVFGGYGSYPFNPAAVGYAVAAVSWPEQVFRYPQPYTNIPLWDVTGVPVSSTISDTLRSGGSLNISAISLVLGEYAAPMGTGAALILLACGLFLWLQKDVRLSASVSFVVTCALIAFLFPRQVGVNGVDIALRLQYDGTAYHGWQVQPNGETIEGVLNRTLSSLLGEKIIVTGASRTDAGVHSMGNVAVFDTKSRIPAEKISYALNQRLPEDIVVQKSEEVPADFHPRHCDSRKTYEYRILNREFPLPMYRNNTYFCYRKLDLEKMQQAAEYLRGEHDFKSFCATAAVVETTVRTIYELTVSRQEDIITIRVTGNGFLYNMVRIIAGTLLQAGMGMIEPEEIKTILAAKERSAAGPTAPAQGLTMIGIEYL